jgi:hypothetical protein
VVERLTNRSRDEHPDRAALERLARFDPVFHTARLREADSADDDFAAGFHLGQLLRHQPWAADLLVKQAHVFARQRQPQQAALSLTRARLLDPGIKVDEPGFAARGERAAQAGNWLRALALWRILIEQPGACPGLRSDLLLTELASGDTESAHRTAGALIATLAGQEDAAVAALYAAPLSDGRVLDPSARQMQALSLG